MTIVSVLKASTALAILEKLLMRTSDEAHDLSEWLQNWNDETDPKDLCRFSYQERKSDVMQLLA